MQSLRGLQRNFQRGSKRGNSQPPENCNFSHQSIPTSSSACHFAGNLSKKNYGPQSNESFGAIELEGETDQMSLDPSPVSVRSQQKRPASSSYTSFLDADATAFQPKQFSPIGFVEVEPEMTKLNYESLKPLRPRRIQIVEILSAQCFYIQQENFLNILNELNEKCNSASALPGSHTDHYDSNQMCLVKAINKQWHRGRVLKAQGGIFDILLVDTAAVVKITNTSNMRLISHSLAFSPPHGAELCCLYNTEAKGDVRAVRQAMIEMVEKPHTLVVVEVIGERKMVDVIIDEKYSMRDALISLHMVRTELTINLSNKVRSDNLEALNTKIALVYKNTNKVVPENHLPAGLLKRVKISHKVSPFEIYVLDEDDVDMQEMGFELNRLYSGAPRDHCFLIREGLYCVCLKDDIYHRVKVLQGCGDNRQVKVFFLEIGITAWVHWHDLYVLDEAFFKLPQCAIRCSLNHIQPCQRNFQWTEKNIKDFNLLITTTRPIDIETMHIDRSQKVKICYIKMFILRQEKRINVNAFMVHELKMAESLGPDSARVIEELEQSTYSHFNPAAETLTIFHPPPKTVKKVNKERMRAKVVNCLTPGEFYVTLDENVKGIEQLNALIKEHTEDILQSKWKVGDLCLVFCRCPLATTNETAKQWNRGKIVEINSVQNSTTCFLTDYGHKINVELSSLMEMPEKFDRVLEGVTKCHLSSCIPTGGSNIFSMSAIDQFCRFVAKFGANIAVTQYGNKNTAGSMPVILWGLEMDSSEAMAPARIKYHSVIRFLCDEGYIYTREQFLQPSEFDPEQWHCGKQMFNEWLQNMIEHIDKSIAEGGTSHNIDESEVITKHGDNLSFNNFTVSIHKQNIQAWSAATVIDKSMFVAKPTFVDDHCIIYLQGLEQGDLIKNMTEVINRFYKKRFEVDKYCFKKVSNNTPCIARYSLDNRFHRGLVLRQVSTNTYKVRFVDYGNVETVPAIDLFTEVLLAEIPIQAFRYSLDDLIPNNFDGKWPRSTIDFVHANIVDKSCQIRVNNDYLDERSSDVVKPCTVFIEDLNIQLNDYMIREKLAKYAELNTIDRYLKDLDANKEQQMIVEDVNEREQLFLRMEHEVVQMKHDELLSSLHRDREVDANEDETKRLMRATGHDSDDQMSDDCQVVERHVVSINLSSSDDDMERGPTYKNVFPKDSSSKFEHQDSIFKFNEDDLKMLDIQKMKLMEFRFELMGYDKNRLFVCPKTRMHSQDMNELEKVLAHLTASSDKLRKLRRLREKQLCLAKWAIDGMWYRARIFKVHECRTKVTVQFIDYLNFETVDESDLKDLPSGCFSYPIKHFPATCGSTVNLMNEGMLMEAVKGYKLFARIKEFSEEGVPEIQIYDEYTEKLLFRN